MALRYKCHRPIRALGYIFQDSGNPLPGLLVLRSEFLFSGLSLAIHTERFFLNPVNPKPKQDCNYDFLIDLIGVKFKSNLDCNYPFPIDLAPIKILIGVLNLSENSNYNPNLVWINKNKKKIICV